MTDIKRIFILLIIFICTLAVSQLSFAKDKKKNKTPRFDWMGVPFLKFRSDFGIGGGAKVSLYDYGKERQKPFKYNLQLQYFATSLGKNDHVLFFVAPNILKTGWYFDLEIRYQFLDNSKYFGVGNDSKNIEEYFDEDDPLYISKQYYEYKRTKPRFIVNLQKTIGSKFRVLWGLGIQKTKIKCHSLDPNLSYLTQDNPFGKAGGYTNFFKLGIVYDSRDFIAAPNSGTWTEFTIELAHELLGSDYRYERYTATDRRYFSLFKRGVLAQRLIYEWMSGSPPFYEYSFIGGSATLMEGLGGNKALRGYLQNRFIDKTKLISNTEFRYLFGTTHYKNERFDFSPVVFWDMGRVYSKVEDFTLEHIKYSYGGGLRIAWNKLFIGRIDAGFSEEGYGLNIGFANIF